MKTPKQRSIKARDMMSGKKIFAIIIGCLVLSCLIFVVPSYKKPFITEASIAIGIWWLTWVGILTKILYSGWRIDDDLSTDLKIESGKKSNWLDFFDISTAGDGLGGLIASFFISVLFAFFGYILIELLLPLFAWLAYTIVLKMLRTAAHDRHDCERNFLLSMGFATFWAAIYVLPLILCVFIVKNLNGISSH